VNRFKTLGLSGLRGQMFFDALTDQGGAPAANVPAEQQAPAASSVPTNPPAQNAPEQAGNAPAVGSEQGTQHPEYATLLQQHNDLMRRLDAAGPEVLSKVFGVEEELSGQRATSQQVQQERQRTLMELSEQEFLDLQRRGVAEGVSALSAQNEVVTTKSAVTQALSERAAQLGYQTQDEVLPIVQAVVAELKEVGIQFKTSSDWKFYGRLVAERLLHGAMGRGLSNVTRQAATPRTQHVRPFCPSPQPVVALLHSRHPLNKRPS
jgi:hypothetical protein